jgi:hypothetical protein
MVKRAPSFQSGARFAFFANDDSGGGLDSVRVRGDGGGLDKLDPAPADVIAEPWGELVETRKDRVPFVRKPSFTTRQAQSHKPSAQENFTRRLL